MNSRLQMPSAMPACAAERLSDVADTMQIDVFLEQARQDIVETVMLFGQYPQPRSSTLYRNQAPRPVQFDLQEWLFDEAGKMRVDPVEAAEFFVLALIDQSRYGAFDDSRSRWEKRITEMLMDYFTDDHHIVREVAEKLMDDAREEL